MRKLNGITINGEYLGNSVVINGMFRAICTISPVIMRDFVHIINKIDKLDNAVKIRNFNCGFDCINIEFENTVSKGIASLYFKLKNGEPELTNCKLVIDNQEYSTFEDKITLRDKKNMTNPNGEETERQRKIRELRERKMEQQKKLIEEKRKKLEELKKRAGEQKSMSLQELREKKRQELLEKKKQELLAKKRQAAGITESPTEKDIKTTDTAENAVQASANAENKPISGDKPITNTISAHKDEASTQAEMKKVTSSSASDTAVSDSEIAKDSAERDLQSGINTSGDELNEGITEKPMAEDELINSDSEEIEENDTENIDEPSDYDISDDNFDEKEFSEYDFSEDELSENDTSFNDYTDNTSGQDNYDDISDEELAALEAELDSEMSTMSNSDFGLSDENAMLDAELSKYTDSSSQGAFGGSFTDFARELKDGLSQGLSEGLSKGLSEGLCALFGGGAPKGGFGGGNTGNFGDATQGSGEGGIQYKQTGPDFGQIDDFNNSAAMSARDSYSFDEDSDLDGLSDLYSDFYSEVPEEEVTTEEANNSEQQKQEENGPMSEVDALNAELEALKAAANQPQKELMTLDEFLEKQKELANAKEKIKRQKLRILGSKERINASALDNGVFVAGNKVYKWGETRVLED